MKYSRRLFLQTVGSAGAGLALSGLGLAQGEETADPSTSWLDREETWSASICQQCPGGCGIKVRKIDGHAVKIEGNVQHPVNRGRLCPKGHAALQGLYDPDRIRGPLQRSGERGSGAWKRVSWESALGIVQQRLSSLRSAGEPHRLAILGGQYRGSMDQLWQRFFQAFGSPNYIHTNCMQSNRAALSHQLAQGIEGPLGYDLRHANYILSFGCNLLEAWRSPVHSSRAYAANIAAAAGRSAKLVQVDPRLSVTAAKADRWLPLNPGTDAALALGIAYVIIREHLYDARFVRDFTFGFEDWTDEEGLRQQGYRTVVLEGYEPSRVAEITGVTVETIIHVAREFAQRQPALAIGDRGVSLYANEISSRLAVHSLNALVGNIGKKGGILAKNPLPLTPWPEPEVDEVARSGAAKPRIDSAGRGRYLLSGDAVQALPANLMAAKPYGIDTLFFYGANPIFSHPNASGFRKALEKIGLLVSFSPYLDETTMLADLVLPDHTPLERWLDDHVTHLAGFSAFSIGPPAIRPLFDTRATGDVMLALAKQLGGAVARNLPWTTYEELLRFSARGLFAAPYGYVVSTPEKEGFRQLLRQRGFWKQEFGAFEKFWTALVERGAWSDAEENYGVLSAALRTPSRRFEFFSQTLRRRLEAEAQRRARDEKLPLKEALQRLTRDLGLGSSEALRYLPHYQAPVFYGRQRSYPLHLTTYKLMSRSGSRTANQAWLQEGAAVHLESDWDAWVEINPATARRLGIVDDDWVVVESTKGRIRLKARLYAGAMPNMVNIAYGAGHTAMGRWAKGFGSNPNDVIIDATDTMRGFAALGQTRVRVVKV